MQLMKLAYIALALGACTDDAVDSTEQARRAYLGLDTSVQKSLQLGFDGFNMATSANIAPQMAAGTKTGMLTVTGQVDQGNSANKGMRLDVGMVGYTDGPFLIDTSGHTITVTYDTSTDMTMQPHLTLSLKGIPTGTLDGTLAGEYNMTGSLKGTVTLDLTFSGTLMDAGGGKTARVPGNTTVTGTATNAEGGVYMIDLKI